MLCVGTSGAKQPDRAGFPFVAALVATGFGNEAQIALMGEATQLMKDSVSAQIQAADWPPLGELVRSVVAYAIPIFI